ncbi:MAG: hypothetical protein LN588_03615 [Rickettsia endosymbiont of Bryobia graminum]|nr:hypothetical protein [Rickettsia endosymbiont of Bryobia graminum]
MKNFLAAILTLAFSISTFAGAEKKVEEMTNKVEHEVKDEAGKKIEEVKHEIKKEEVKK